MKKIYFNYICIIAQWSFDRILIYFDHILYVKIQIINISRFGISPPFQGNSSSSVNMLNQGLFFRNILQNLGLLFYFAFTRIDLFSIIEN